MTSRSERTRAAILAAARARFAASGFRATTVRAIAADAGIDAALVIRHFGSKADLFAAAVDVDVHIPDLTNVPRDRLGATLVDYFLERWEDDPGEALLTLLRSAATDDHAAQRLRTLFVSQLLPQITAIIADPAEAPRRAGLVATQTIGLAFTRHVLRLPPVVELERAELVARVGATLQRYLVDDA